MKSLVFGYSCAACSLSYVLYIWLLFGPGGNGLKHIIFGIHSLTIVLAVLLGVVALFQKRPIAVIPVLGVLPLFYIQFLS
jgi:hypothetical protein